MSPRINLRNSSGFTIPEVLLGSLICAIAIIMVVNVYSMLSQLWQEDLILDEFSREANIAMERMARGSPANTGLTAAKSISAPEAGTSANSIDFTDMNGVSRRFYYSGGKIYTEGGRAILSDVESVTFTNLGRMIQIGITLHRNALKKEFKLYMETQIKIRN